MKWAVRRRKLPFQVVGLKCVFIKVAPVVMIQWAFNLYIFCTPSPRMQSEIIGFSQGHKHSELNNVVTSSHFTGYVNCEKDQNTHLYHEQIINRLPFCVHQKLRQ